MIIQSGSQFGALTVLEHLGSKKGCRVYRCRCICGTLRDVLGKSLNSGNTRSCGCQHRPRKHGYAPMHGPRHPVYKAWQHMRGRCRNPRDPDYPDYGGRGITVDPRWDDFAQFLADMGPKPTPQHTIDRVNNDGNYEPGNCRWATAKEQSRNRHCCHRDAIVALLATADHSLAAHEISAHIGVPAIKLYGALGRMVKEGEIVRIRRRYAAMV